MPAPNDRNALIALVKGWTWIARDPVIETGWGRLDLSRLSPDVGEWRNPQGEPAMHPDFVGTLEGVAGMLSELNSLRGQCWVWIVNPEGGTGTQYTIENPASCFRIDATAPLYPPRFDSPRDRPGDCVGEAYLSMKEAVDAG